MLEIDHAAEILEAPDESKDGLGLVTAVEGASQLVRGVGREALHGFEGGLEARDHLVHRPHQAADLLPTRGIGSRCERLPASISRAMRVTAATGESARPASQ